MAAIGALGSMGRRNRGERGSDSSARKMSVAPGAGVFGNMFGGGADDEPRRSVGEVAQPSANEPPPRNNEEFQQRVKRNAEWAQSPEVQAALLQFAVTIMQPVNSPAGFMGRLGQAIGGGFQAASRVREGTLEEEKAAREAAIDERKMKVAEGSLAVSEGNLKISQQELGLKLQAGRKQSVIVDSKNAINKLFGLGIPDGSQAKVEITTDKEGNVIEASVEAGFEGGSGSKEKSSAIEQLQIDRAEALARGDQKAAAEIDLKIRTEGSGEAAAKEGRILTPDPNNPGQFIQTIVPGSPAALEEAELKKVESEKWAQGAIAAATVNIQGRKALEILERNPMPDLFVTGIGGLVGQLPIGSDASDLRLALDAIKANVGITSIQNMRESSPTGAALGPVSDYENQILQTVLGSLDQYGRASTLADNVRRVMTTMQLIADNDVIGRVGEQVKAGILTPEQGLAEVERLIDAKVTENVQTKAEQAREAARGTADAGTGPLQTPAGPGSLSGETASPMQGQMNEPAPPPPATLTPEEQTQVDIMNQIEEMASQHKEGAKDDVIAPEMPSDLSESDQDIWEALDPIKKRIFLNALQQSKAKKKLPPPKEAGAIGNFIFDLMTPTFEKLTAPESAPSGPPIQIDPKSLGKNSPLRRK